MFHNGIKKLLVALGAAVVAISSATSGQDDVSPSAPGTELYFIAPQDGATLKSPVHVSFGLRGMGVAPAGVEHEGTGHHHLIIDVPLPALDDFIPADDNHVHFGGGQTETQITLAPGVHTLQLLLGDPFHLPHNPPVFSKQITVTIVE